MSRRYPRSIISSSVIKPNLVSASGFWKLQQHIQYVKSNIWPALVDAPAGQQAYTSPGTYEWIAPAGVTSVSVVAVGGGGGGGSTGSNGGGGGGGGGLGWKNNITVIPGQGYGVVVGIGGTRDSSTHGGQSFFIDPSIVAGLGGNSSSTASGRACGG
jgi:hypothetical protein